MTKDENEIKVGLARPIKSVAIIGGGASGAIVLDALVKEGKFNRITVFERRDKLGGVWQYDENIPQLKIPPGATEKDLDPPLKSPLKKELDETSLTPRSTQQRYYETASYGWMRTNIPEQFMSYSDSKKWPKLDRPGADTYTRGKYISEYIESYFGRHDPKQIVLRTSVENVEKTANSQFALTLRTETDITNQAGEPLDIWYKEVFDAVVVTIGHYHVPYIPHVDGLDEVYSKYPERFEHAKTFRSIEKYADKTVIVVGSRASGADIAKFIKRVAKETYNSRRTVALQSRITDDMAILKPIITKYEPTEEGFDVHFEDGSVVSNPDVVLYGTGYRFSYPFLDNLIPDLTNGVVVNGLYQHTFLRDEPAIAFVGIPTDGISFRVFEYQAILVSRFFGGLVELPSKNDQNVWLKDRIEQKGSTRAYHTIGADFALTYFTDLTELGGGVRLAGQNDTARSFPVFSDEEFEELTKAREILVKFWDEH